MAASQATQAVECGYIYWYLPALIWRYIHITDVHASLIHCVQFGKLGTREKGRHVRQLVGAMSFRYALRQTSEKFIHVLLVNVAGRITWIYILRANAGIHYYYESYMRTSPLLFLHNKRDRSE